MRPGPNAPCSLAGLLAVFRPCFTAPTFHTFVGLVVGLMPAELPHPQLCTPLWKPRACCSSGSGLTGPGRGDQRVPANRLSRIETPGHRFGDSLGTLQAQV